MDENITARRYRNRRIGDFFKELHLTEGRSTGFRKIRRSLEANGSPEPVFETDDDRSYFLAILNVHPEAQVGEQVSEQVSEQVGEQAIQILEFCKIQHTKQEILNHIGLSPVYMNYKRHILPLLQSDLLAFTIPAKPKSRLQKYVTTRSGFQIINQQIELKGDK